MKPSSSLLIIFAFSFTLAGCSGFSGSHGQGKDVAQKNNLKEQLSIVINDLGMSFPEGLDENNNPYLDYIEKNTDLDVEVIIPPSEVYNEKLNVIMASDNLPDMINVFDDVWIDNYVKQRALLPLDDLIDKYGPDLKANISKAAWDRVKYDGKIYAIPSIDEIKGIELMYARKDWLDRLGLNPPTTLDEYYNVIKAFTLDDPDGNGVNDTIGLIFTFNMGRSAPFFGAFGVQQDIWLEREGTLVNSSILPETKEALAYLARLYKEKLLDPEFPLNRNTNLVEKIQSGKVGLFSAAWYDTRGPIADNKQSDPKANWIPLEYPTGSSGNKGVYNNDLIRQYDVIPASSKNPVGAIKMLNFIAGKGHKSLKLGFENEVWKMEGSKMITNFQEHNKHLYRGIYQSLVEVDEPDLLRARLDSLGDFDLYANLQKIEKNLIENEFSGTPTPAMSKYSTKLSALEEVFTKIVMGIVPIGEFDRFVERWKQEGGNEITKEVNEWYRNEKKR